MKKFLSMLLVVVLCLTGLLACGGNGDNGEDAAALADAAAYLNAMYKDKATNTPNDYDVVAKVVVGGKTYTVTWTTNNENIVVKESSKTGFWTIDVPDVVTEEISYTITAKITDANGNSEEKTFNRVVPVVNKGGITSTPEEGVAYKLYINQAKLQQRFYALTTTQQDNKFIETTNDAKQAADFYVEKVDGGVKIYTTIDGVKTYVYAKTTTGADNKVSKYVGFSTENSTVFEYVQATNSWQTTIDGTKYVFGTYSTYQTACISEATYITAENTGVTQFVVEFMTKAHAETLEPDGEVKVEVPTPNTTLTIPEANELGVKVITYTEGKYYVTGVVDSIKSTTYGNIYIKDEAGNTFYIYGTYSADGSARFDAMTTQPAVGDTITVYGVIGNYNGNPQMQNGWITEINGEGGSETPDTPETPSANYGVVAEVAADTAYKFGMIQGNVSTTTVYYLAGGMDSYYMATTDNAANAIDVYLETTEGGYYLYTKDAAGTKTYINMVVSADGAHVNGAYEATASTVYTFDAEKGTIVATVNEELYWFGTRNDRNYTTVGPCAISYKGFYCQFYAEVEGGTETPDPENPETPDEPETPTVITTIPEALTAAVGTNVVLQGVVINAEAWNTQYNDMSVTIKDTEGNTIYVYQLKTQVGLGDTITVTGTIGTYNNANQVAAGATAVIDVVHGDNHTYENGSCTVCGSTEPVAGIENVKCDFSTVSGVQYADETKAFGDYVTVSTNNKGCHFNTQLRIYDSSSNNGNAVVAATGTITGFKVNAGYKVASLEVYGSVDGETWVLIETISTTTSYTDYTVAIDAAAGYKYLKLDAVGAQVRIPSIEVSVQV